jgi:hypothetical protein
MLAAEVADTAEEVEDDLVIKIMLVPSQMIADRHQIQNLDLIIATREHYFMSKGERLRMM